MNRVRFQVGVPRAGDSARLAEGEPRSRSLSSIAGSAARAAEEAKRVDAAPAVPGARSISMRAKGGRVFQDEENAAATSGAISAAALPVQASSMNVPPTAGSAQSSIAAVASVAKVSAMNGAEDPGQPGVLQTAATRVQSLVRSFFSGGRAHTETNARFKA